MGFKITNTTPKRYFILGSPCSATSLLSKALQDQGIEMGYMGNNEWCMEDMSFVELNRQIYQAHDSDLTAPPNQFMDAQQLNLTQLQTHLQSKPYLQNWGVKDPRFAFTLHYYLPYLEQTDNYVIGIFRDPETTAQAWARRLKKNTDEILPIVRQYHEKTLWQIQQFLNHKK